MNYLLIGLLISTTVSMQTVEEDIIVFSQGILEGLTQNNTGNITDIIACLKGFANSSMLHLISEELHQAIELLRQFDIAHWNNIVNGIYIVVNITYQVYGIAKPCISSVKEFEIIIKLLDSVNPAILIAKLTKNFALHSPEVLKDIFDFVSSVDKHLFEKAGYDVGDLVYVLLIN
jgi:hypothetical protein